MLGLLPGPSSLTGVDPSAAARIPGNLLSTTLPKDNGQGRRLVRVRTSGDHAKDGRLRADHLKGLWHRTCLNAAIRERIEGGAGALILANDRSPQARSC